MLSLGAPVAALAATILMAVAVAQEAGPAGPAEAASAPSVNAIWVEKDLAFTYLAFTTYYSCDGLRDKVRGVLREIGARPGFEVTVRGCTRPSGPEVMPRVEIHAALPMAATPDLLAALAKEASKRELVARVTGQSADEATAQFAARWREIRFDPTATSRIEPGDCELMEQLRDAVFLPFGLRLIEDRLTCVPKQLVLQGIRLTVAVLEPVPEPTPVNRGP